MKTDWKINNISRFVSCIFMMLALAWLTVSFPIVYSAQQVAKQNSSVRAGGTSKSDKDKTDNPFANTTEEKTSGNSNSFSEEYLHHTHSSVHYTTVLSIEYTIEHFSTYIAFYGDLESPPPDLA